MSNSKRKSFRIGIIYKATCLISKKSYIGRTIFRLEKRRSVHVRESKNKKTYFHRALQKYGIENFEWVVLEQCPEKNLNAREIFWIAYESTLTPLGYNLTKGGEGTVGWTPSPETKLKISQANKGEKSAWLGKKHSQEEKEKMALSIKEWWNHASIEEKENRSRNISLRLKGRKLSEEARASLRRNRKSNNPWKGKHLPEATRKKISATRIRLGIKNQGHPHSETSKKLISDKARLRKLHRTYTHCLASFHGNCSKYEKGKFCGKHKTQYRVGIIDINGNSIREPKVKHHAFNQCILNSLGECSVYIGGRFCGKHRSQYGSGIIDINGNKLRDFKKPGLKPKQYTCKLINSGKCSPKYEGNGFCSKHRSQYRKGIIDIEGNKLREPDRIYKNS